MNRDFGFIISMILLAIANWLNYTYDNQWLILLVVVIGIIAIRETSLLGTHKYKRCAE